MLLERLERRRRRKLLFLVESVSSHLLLHVFVLFLARNQRGIVVLFLFFAQYSGHGLFVFDFIFIRHGI